MLNLSSQKQVPRSMTRLRFATSYSQSLAYVFPRCYKGEKISGKPLGSTKLNGLDRSAVEDELQRLVGSQSLHQSESLCSLLRYLVQHALDKPGEHLKEYQIAVEVFGRSESFDPRLDSTIRVQTSRLRSKLVDYYATTGASDPVIIEVPRGTYSPLIQRRAPAVRPPTEGGALAPTPGETKSDSKGRRWTLVLGVLAGLITGIAVSWTMWGSARSARSRENRTGQAEVHAFWSSVLKNPAPPLVIFSNAEFVGRPESGLRYFDRSKDSPNNIEDLYTGVGETLAVAQLSDLFAGFGREIVVKRSRLLSWDETKNRDLIFVGSPSENLSLQDLPLSQEFVFRRMTSGEPRPGDLAIVNSHPRAGEPKLFLATATLPLTEDYGLVTLQTGLHGGQNVLWLAGTTTMGTQAAAEFVCSSDGLQALRSRLGIASTASYGPFSAVLHVRVARGSPVETTIAAAHAPAK